MDGADDGSAGAQTAGMSRPPARPHRAKDYPFKALRRAVSWHRRKLAVVAAVAAMLTGINAALPPAPPTVAVVRATRMLDGGATIGTGDVAVVRLPAAAVPDGAVADPASVLGRTLTAPVARGQVLTGLDLVAGGSGVRAGHVVAPLHLADADLAGLLAVGDVVDVIAADGEARAAAVVARGVRVVAVPQPRETGGIGGSSTAADGVLVLVEVDSRTAAALAQAAVTSTLSVVLR